MPYIGQRPSKGDENNFKILDDISSYTLTFDGSDSSVVSAANDTITSLTHRFVQGQRVTYTDGSGSAIAGLTDATVYFIIKEDHNTIKLATSASNASNGIAVNITNVGSGSSHTLNVAFDGVNTKFKATHTNGQKAKITRSAQLVISMNGVIQQPHDTATPSTGFGFDLDGTIVFSQAPVSSDVFWAHVLTNNNVTFDISNNDIDNFTGDGSTVAFNLSKSPPDNRNLLVTVDGVVQYPNDPDGTERSYTVVENVLTFSTAPALGTEVQVRHIGFAGSTSGSGGVSSFYGRTGAVVLKSTDNIVANNATFSGDLTVNGTTTTLDTQLVEVDKIEVETGGSNVGVAVTHNGSGDLIRLYDGSTQVVTVDDEGTVSVLTTGDNKGLRVHTNSGVSATNNELRFNTGQSSGFTFMMNSDGTSSNEKVRIAADGNVGIGSATPGRALTIQNSEPRIRLQKPNLGHGEIYIDDDNSINLSADSSSSVGTSSIIFRTNGAEKVRIKEDKVGIGTDNPATQLEIHGDSGGTIRLAKGGTNRTTVLAGDTLGKIEFRSYDASLNHNSYSGTYAEIETVVTHDLGGLPSEEVRLDFKIADSDEPGSGKAITPVPALSILQGGSVGIGSTIPLGAMALDVIGSIRYSAAMRGATGSNATPSYAFYGDHDTGMYRGSGINILSFATAGTERLSINSDGDVIIGSGNGSPWSYPKALNVQGSSGSILSLYNADTTTYAANTTTAIEFKLLTGNTGTTNASCEIRAFKENGTNGNSARALSFYTGENGGSPTERLRITSTGAVGINTTVDAATKLQVQTDTTSTTAGGNVVARFQSNGSGRDATIQLSDNVANSATISMLSSALIFKQSGVETLHIKSNGNVGIGSADPGGVLDLYHATSNTILNVKSGDSGSVINLIDNATRSSIEQNGTSLKIISDTVGSYANSDIRLQIDGGTKMRINSDGEVLIGTTTNPTADIKLLVAGNGGVSSGSYFSFRADYGNVPEPAAYAIKYDSSATHLSGAGGLHQYAYGGIAFNLGGQDRVNFTTTGNVGIGTETPGSKLSIMGGSIGSGAINALELKHYTANNGGDGTALLFNGGYQNNAWEHAKISAVNAGSGFGADLQVHVHPADGTQGSSVVKALSIIGNGSNGGIIRMENSKVGIGTNSPRATYLHVGEAYNAGNVFTSSPLSVFASGNLGGTAGNSQKIAIFGGKTGGNTSGLSIYHYRRANGTDWTTDGFSLRQEVDNTSGIYDFMNFTAGNVGVNNANPTAKLHVQGAYNQTAAKVGAGGTGYTNAFEVYNANGTLQFAVNTNDIKLGLGHRALYYQRNLAAAINSTTEIVRFTRTHGAHSMRVSIVCSSSGFSVAKVYEITTSYNQTTGGWRVVRPISSTGRYDSNFELLINVTNTQTDLKLRKIDFATYAGNCDISINYTGSYSQGVTVTNKTATGTDSTAYDVFEEGFGLYDVNNGQTALTLPTYHPAFLVHPANDAETADGYVTYTSVSYNNGSHYKTSGGNAGKFIAPVFGRYFFAANYVGGAGSENVFVRFYVNGALTNKGQHYSGGGIGAWVSTGSPYMSCDLTGTCIQLAKDDYVQLHLTATNGGGQGQAGYMRYFGYLVG